MDVRCAIAKEVVRKMSPGRERPWREQRLVGSSSGTRRTSPRRVGLRAAPRTSGRPWGGIPKTSWPLGLP